MDKKEQEKKVAADKDKKLTKASWTKEEEEILKKLYSSATREELLKALPNRTWAAISLHGGNTLGLKRDQIKKANGDSNGSGKVKKEVPPPPAMEELEKKEWPEPRVFELDPKKWKEADPRVGFMSGLDFRDSGFRAGLLETAFEVFNAEACRYICLVGRVVNKHWVKDQLKDVPAKYKKQFLAALVENYARGLSSVIPRIKRSANEYVRIYIITSPPYDGEIGEKIVQRLQELRPEEIRVYNIGSDRVLIKEAGDKAIGLICPEMSRLPSEYFSAMVEREVKDKEGQTNVGFPDLWVVGGTSSSVHIPGRGRKPPVISLPSLKRLQKVRVGENQQGIRVIKFSRDGKEYFVRNYSLKDFTMNERSFIGGIKEGAKETHERIVDLLRREGSRSEGWIAEHLGMENDRAKVHEALEFLVEPKMSPRKTWPGLFYDPHAQRYDFHLDWLQERLRYPSLLKSGMTDERFLFFSCMHAGYNTTDYQYIVQELPEIIVRNRVQYLCCLGDVVAGLAHNFLEQGEVLGGMNYTDQETLAAELVGTVLLKVLEKNLKLDPDLKKLPLKELLSKAMPKFYYRSGNHDDWQRRLGVSPLVTFRSKLFDLLASRVEVELKKSGVTVGWGELRSVLNDHLVRLSIEPGDYQPSVKLPSGLTLEMHHPHMGRSKTKSLRAQELLESSDSHIVGHGNFHTAIVTEKWEPDLGQRVNVEAGTFVIFTDFEKNKGNKKVNFGPVYLRVLASSGRVVMTESAFYNTPLLQEPRPKWTDWQKLKDELGIYRSP